MRDVSVCMSVWVDIIYKYLYWRIPRDTFKETPSIGSHPTRPRIPISK